MGAPCLDFGSSKRTLPNSRFSSDFSHGNKSLSMKITSFFSSIRLTDSQILIFFNGMMTPQPHQPPCWEKTERLLLKTIKNHYKPFIISLLSINGLWTIYRWSHPKKASRSTSIPPCTSSHTKGRASWLWRSWMVTGRRRGGLVDCRYLYGYNTGELTPISWAVGKYPPKVGI